MLPANKLINKLAITLSVDEWFIEMDNSLSSLFNVLVVVIDKLHVDMHDLNCINQHHSTAKTSILNALHSEEY